MPNSRQPRPAQPRRWTSSLAVGATITLAAMPALAATANRPAPISLATPDTQVWLAQAEGGEGGEAGATADLSPDIAYLTQLALVEGHLRAAALLYEKGQPDEAIGLSYHPEAEMMDEVRANLAAHGAADITPAMTAMSQAMEAGADLATVTARLGDLHALIAAATAPEDEKVRTRFDAIVALTKAAAHEYEESLGTDAVEDVMAWHEAWAFLQIARDLATALSALPDAKAAAAGAKIVTALDAAAPAFGDLMAATPLVGDPGILLAVAGRVELAASQVR